MVKPKTKFMKEAILQANTARKKGDYAIGALIVMGNVIISMSGNRVKRDENPNAHAEVIAINKASKMLGSRHLQRCVLYTTHEPCPMCSALCVFSRLKGIVYGANIEDMKNYSIHAANKEYLWRTINITAEEIISKSNEKIEIVKDFMRDKCLALFHNKKL